MKAFVLAAAILLLGLAMPTVPLQRTVYDYIVVFDISQSMNVEDYDLDGANVSRLDFARSAALQALRKLPCGSRVGWGAFTASRTLLLLAPVEVCDNYNDLLASLAQIDGRMRWAEASAISKGLYWAVDAARSTPSPRSIRSGARGAPRPWRASRSRARSTARPRRSARAPRPTWRAPRARGTGSR